MPTTIRKRKAGRPEGSKNRGYYYRSGRGWTATGSSAVLTDALGNKLKDRKTPDSMLQEAYIQWRMAEQERATVAAQLDKTANAIPLMELCQAYLDHCKANDAPSTYKSRHALLFNLCMGLADHLRHKGQKEIAEAVEANPKLRKHDGYGDRLLSGFNKADVSQWLARNPGWSPTGKGRMAVQAIKRAINWAMEYMPERVKSNPLVGYKTKNSNRRVTYFKPDLEQALYDNARPPFRLALKVLIKTGARYGCEFAKVEARNVEDMGNRMQWRWPKGTKVKGKPRIIKITDPELIATVRMLCQRHPTGQIFRGQNGKPWTKKGLSMAWGRLKEKVEMKGFVFDPDDCLYSTRHTYAKRMLGGYWTGKPCTLEILAGLMGNTRDVCWRNYGEWCSAYEDPQWDALGITPVKHELSVAD